MEIKLLEYFQKVAALEKDKYTYECLSANITSEIAGLEREYKDPRVDVNTIKKKYPILDVECQEPVVLSKPKDYRFINCVKDTLIAWVAFLIMGGIGLVVVEFFFTTKISAIVNGLVWIPLIIWAPFGAIGAQTKEYRDKYEAYKQSKIEFEKYNETTTKKAKAKLAFFEDIENTKKQRQTEIQNIIASLKHERETVKTSYEKVCEALKDIYNENVIYPKYRELIPVTMMCEYLESNRCETLEGHEGAYNIYESEIRANVIISRLDQVMSSLESIRSNQYKLHEAIQEARRDSNRIAHSMMREIASSNQQQIALAQQNQALLEYNNQVAERIHDIQETEFWVR